MNYSSTTPHYEKLMSPKIEILFTSVRWILWSTFTRSWKCSKSMFCGQQKAPMINFELLIPINSDATASMPLFSISQWRTEIVRFNTNHDTTIALMLRSILKKNNIIGVKNFCVQYSLMKPDFSNCYHIFSFSPSHGTHSAYCRLTLHWVTYNKEYSLRSDGCKGKVVQCC